MVIESPSNPRLEVTDRAAATASPREHGIVTLADNTFATPVIQRSVELGVDLVWHGGTNYPSSHSDASAWVAEGGREPDARLSDARPVLRRLRRGLCGPRHPGVAAALPSE
jgi:methionine-gamma-lyase